MLRAVINSSCQKDLIKNERRIMVNPAIYIHENLDILACRTCLDTDVLLYDLSEPELVEILSEFTGNPISPSDGYPQYICKQCLYLLRKLVRFRHRCIKAMYLLQQLETEVGCITTDNVKTLDRGKLYYDLITTDVELLDIVNNVTPSADVKTEVQNYENVNNLQLTEVPNNYIVINNGQIIGNFNKIDEDFGNDDDDYMNAPLIDVKNILDASKKSTPNKKPLKRKSEEKKKYLTKKKKDVILQSEDEDENMNEVCKKRIEEIKRDIADGKKKYTELQEYKDYVQKLQNLAQDYNLKVTFLTKEEQMQTVKEKKMSIKFKNAEYKCNDCYQIFQRPDALENHAVTHTESRGKIVCDICKARFREKSRLKFHYNQRHTVEVHCNTCGRKMNVFFSDRFKDIIDHYEWHQGKHKLYKCDQCNVQFTLKKQYYMHISQKHGGQADGPECLLCDNGQSFFNNSGLFIHYSKSHKTNPRCPSCKTVFADDDALTVHSNVTGGCHTGCSSCPKCGANFPNENEMKTHFNEVHRKGYFKCNECPRQFKLNKQLEKHIKNHKNKIKSSTEDVVTADVRYNSMLTRRLNGEVKRVQKESTEKKSVPLEKMVCEICGVLYPKITHLQHMRLHTGEKPYQCDYCDRQFRLKHALKQHVAVHTGQKQYKCHLCPKAFRQYNHRKYHMVTHTKEKPYECPYCGKTFGFNDNMKTHIRTLHLGLPPQRKNRVRKGKQVAATTQWLPSQIDETTY